MLYMKLFPIQTCRVSLQQQLAGIACWHVNYLYFKNIFLWGGNNILRKRLRNFYSNTIFKNISLTVFSSENTDEPLLLFLTI